MKLISTLIVCGAVSLGGVNLAAGQEQRQQPSPPQLASQTVDAQGIRNYLLGPGDVLDIKIFGQYDLSSTAQVDGEGNLSSLPFLESPVVAKCRTELQVQKEIAKAYKRLINDPQVSVRIVQRNSRPPAAVFGAVRSPTRVPMLRKVRLNELIAEAGGLTERAAGTVQILQTEPLMCPGPGQEADGLPINGMSVPLTVVKIADMKSGKRESNPEIRPGDYVLVTEAEQVYVTGSVVSPGPVLLTDRMTLSRVLAVAGGPRQEANLSDVRIYRQKGPAAQEVLRIDFSALKKNKIPDVQLQPYDVIEVREPGLTVWRAFQDGVISMLRSSVIFPRIP